MYMKVLKKWTLSIYFGVEVNGFAIYNMALKIIVVTIQFLKKCRRATIDLLLAEFMRHSYRILKYIIGANESHKWYTYIYKFRRRSIFHHHPICNIYNDQNLLSECETEQYLK